MRKIVHIAPSVPPAINGLGDFCTILSRGLDSDQFSNIYLIYQNDYDNSNRKDIQKFNSSNFGNKLIELKPDVIMLHYVGYAYDPKGLPFYLVAGLKKLIKENETKILIFFHELYSSCKSPFSLAFYTSILQKAIIKRLYSLASTTFTNCTLYAILLRKLTKNKANYNICTGIFSNIPDHYYNKDQEKEQATIVVFGTFQKRKSVYDNPMFVNALQKLKITTIYDIGPGQMTFTDRNTIFCSKGSIPAEQIAIYLNKAAYGAIDYSPSLIGKSGIYSAYAAFGVIPVNFNTSKKVLYDELMWGRNYFDIEIDLSSYSLATLKQEIETWYSQRCAKKITETILKHI